MMTTLPQLPRYRTVLADEGFLMTYSAYPVVVRNAPGHGPLCGNCRVNHSNAAAVRECYRLTAESIAEWQAEQRAEAGYELWLETRYADVMRWEEEQEQRYRF